VGVVVIEEIRPTLVAFSGSKIPALVLTGGTTFSIKTRFSSGIKRLAISENQRSKAQRGRGFEKSVSM